MTSLFIIGQHPDSDKLKRVVTFWVCPIPSSCLAILWILQVWGSHSIITCATFCHHKTCKQKFVCMEMTLSVCLFQLSTYCIKWKLLSIGVASLVFGLKSNHFHLEVFVQGQQYYGHCGAWHIFMNWFTFIQNIKSGG